MQPAQDAVVHKAARKTGTAWSYWGSVSELARDDCWVIELYPSGVASLHDRACEIFYSLKGGTVDYGEEHAREHGHDRYGATCVAAG